jgi:hypothetical protein
MRSTSQDLCRYCGNEPTRATDPSGLAATDVEIEEESGLDDAVRSARMEIETDINGKTLVVCDIMGTKGVDLDIWIKNIVPRHATQNARFALLLGSLFLLGIPGGNAAILGHSRVGNGWRYSRCPRFIGRPCEIDYARSFFDGPKTDKSLQGTLEAVITNRLALGEVIRLFGAPVYDNQKKRGVQPISTVPYTRSKYGNPLPVFRGTIRVLYWISPEDDVEAIGLIHRPDKQEVFRFRLEHP